MGSHRSRSPAETEALGAELAARLSAGQVVLIEGDLGAGKTTFVRGACRALGVTATVRSPTFSIGHRYAAPVPVTHVDLYRVAELDQEDPDLLAEYLRSDTIAFVEWPREGGELATIGATAVRVRIQHAGRGDRTVEIYPR
jgi:tRNA threonylcarbamoyladenosine biosynthesis protein TsaE